MIMKLLMKIRTTIKTVIFLLICIWDQDPLELGILARKWCELGKDGKSNKLISLDFK